jgi:hypothetical protein
MCESVENIVFISGHSLFFQNEFNFFICFILYLNGLKTKNIYFLVANSALLWVKPIVYFYIKKMLALLISFLSTSKILIINLIFDVYKVNLF